jgi:uncharacterized Zn-finger protein
MNSSNWEELWWVSFVILGVWIVNGILIFYLLMRIDTIVNVQLYNYHLQFSNDWADPYWASIRLSMVFLGLPMALSTVVFVLGLSRFKKKIPLFKRKAKPAQVETEKSAEVQLEEKQSNSEVVSAPEPEKKQELTSESTTGLASEPIQEVTSEHVSQPEFEVILPETTQVEEHMKSEPATIPVSEEPVAVNEEPVAVRQEPKVKEETKSAKSCPYCGKEFSRALVMLDFSGGKTRLVSTCPFCEHVLGEDLDSTKSEEDNGA